MIKEIAELYPLVFEELHNYFCKLRGFDPSAKYEITLCYCEIEDYFMEVGIEINYDWKYQSYDNNKIFYSYIVTKIRPDGNGTDAESQEHIDHYFKDKNEARKQAVLKAAEILNNILGGQDD